MNQHTVILAYTPEPLKKLFEFKRRMEEKLSRGEDINQDLKNLTNGSTEIPEGLLKYKRKIN